MSRLELRGAEVPERREYPRAVVEALDVLEYLQRGPLARLEGPRVRVRRAPPPGVVALPGDLERGAYRNHGLCPSLNSMKANLVLAACEPTAAC